MKKILWSVLAVAVLAGLLFGQNSLRAADAEGAEGVNLIGTWKGVSMAMHGKNRGFVETTPSTLVVEIKEQKGRMLTGTKTWTPKGKEVVSEDFSAMVAANGKTVYFAEHHDGMMVGTLVDDDTMELYYVEPGADAKAIVSIVERQK